MCVHSHIGIGRFDLDRPHASVNGFMPTSPPEARRSPPDSACGHHDAGQELCYLCHQRERCNVPVSFTEERRRREVEEDRLLQQYNQLKDMEAVHKEQVLSRFTIHHTNLTAPSENEVQLKKDVDVCLRCVWLAGESLAEKAGDPEHGCI